MFSAFGACRDCARKEAGGGRERVTPLVYFWGKYPTPTHRLGQIQQSRNRSGYGIFAIAYLFVYVKIFTYSLKCKKQTEIYAFEIKYSQNVKY